MIGLPVTVSIPQLKAIRWRYCSRWDEGPAATLGMSLLRLGICRPSDWSGSAVDFVERGFSRFCQEHGAAEAKRVWVGDLRIADYLFELTEQERNQLEAGKEEQSQMLFFIADYEAAASISDWRHSRRIRDRARFAAGGLLQGPRHESVQVDARLRLPRCARARRDVDGGHE